MAGTTEEVSPLVVWAITQTERHHLVKLAKGLLMQTVIASLMACLAQATPYLINAQQRTYRTQPQYIRDNFAWINSWTHFDGMAISTNNTLWIMDGNPRSEAQFAADLAPLDGLNFTYMKHNFVLIEVDRTADFFDNWSVTINNVRNLARVLKQKKIEGIIFDNEEYKRRLWNYPDNCSYPAKTLQQYQDQARLVGKQLMQAIVAEYPEVVLLTYFGPAISQPGAPGDAGGSPSEHELQGPFSVGMMEAMDPRTRNVDGGEIYQLRSAGDFQNSYTYRKFTLASSSVNCYYIPLSERPLWPQKNSISFGVYNLGYTAMDPTIMRSTLENALRRCDEYVWLYFEGLDWNTPGGISQDWINAVKGAKAAVVNSPAPAVAITSPTNGAAFSTTSTVTLNATASEVGGSIGKVEFYKNWVKLGEDTTAPYSYAWINPSASNYTLKATATDLAGVARTSAPVNISVVSGTTSTPSPTPTPTPAPTPTPTPSPTTSPTPVVSGTADLVITNLSWSSAAPGSEVVFSATIKNQGTAATPAGSAGGLFLGVAFQIDGAWVTWSDNYYGSLAPGASITLTPNNGEGNKRSWTATSGTHTLTAIVDNLNKIRETNESNNTVSKTLVSAVPKPDLVITGLNLSPATPTAGSAVTFSATIKNQGTAATPLGQAGGLFLGVGFQIDGQWVSWSDNYYGSLAPGASVTLYPNNGTGGLKTWKATRGSHTLKAIVDNLNLISESTETNNTRSKSVVVP